MRWCATRVLVSADDLGRRPAVADVEPGIADACQRRIGDWVFRRPSS